MSAGPRRSRGLAALVASAALLCLIAAAALAAKDDLTLVSRVSGVNGPGADGSSSSPSISDGGRYVAFESAASNLSGEDVDPSYDVFRRDLQNDVVILVSRATGAAGGGGATSSTAPSISPDGRYVAFSSTADNLSNEDNNTYV